jgi:hypothetical protein
MFYSLHLLMKNVFRNVFRKKKNTASDAKVTGAPNEPPAASYTVIAPFRARD